MGLKTTNYEVKSMKVVLPTAYAYIRELSVVGNKGVAIFAVHENRELASDISVKPYEECKISFAVDRDANDRVTAYNKAKSQIQVKTYTDYGEVEVTQDMPFYGWQDDMV